MYYLDSEPWSQKGKLCKEYMKLFLEERGYDMDKIPSALLLLEVE